MSVGLCLGYVACWCGVCACVFLWSPGPAAFSFSRWPIRVRRTTENKLNAGDERLEDIETELRASKQAAQEWEARYDEVCIPLPPSTPQSLHLMAGHKLLSAIIIFLVMLVWNIWIQWSCFQIGCLQRDQDISSFISSVDSCKHHTFITYFLVRIFFFFFFFFFFKDDLWFLYKNSCNIILSTASLLLLSDLLFWIVAN